MEGLLQLIAFAQTPMEKKVPSCEVSCTAVHDCCSKHISLKNQEGMLCTLFDTRYILTTVDGIPHLLPLFPPQNIVKWASGLSTVVWQNLALSYHKRFLDGTVVKFDAVRVKRTALYQILCIWIGCKPKCFQLPAGQQFLVIQCHSAVPCTYSGSENNLVSVNINGQMRKFEKPRLNFHNEVLNASLHNNCFNGFFLEILENSADSPDIIHSNYQHSLILHAIYGDDLPLSLASIHPMTIYVQNGSGDLELSQANHTVFLDAAFFKDENGLMSTVNGTEQSTLNGLPYFHFCPHKKYPAHVMKFPTGNYTAYALQDCLCCDSDKIQYSESAFSSGNRNSNCLSSPYWFCCGSVMSLDYKQSAISQSNEDIAQMRETSMDTGNGPLRFGSLPDPNPTAGGNTNLELNDPNENKHEVNSGAIYISENSSSCSSNASSQDEMETNYFEEQTRREKHLSLHPEWVSKSELHEKAFTTQDLNSKVLLEMPIIEMDSEFSQSTAKNLQYIMKFNESNEEILEDSDYVQCLDDIYEKLYSCCLIPSTPESFPICFGGEDIFVLQNCTDFRGCCVANYIVVAARNEHFALLKVPFKKLYIVCPLSKLPHLPLTTKTSILYSKESCSRILGAEVFIGFQSWSADRPPVLCHHWCAEHGLLVKPVNDLSYINIYSANNKGMYLQDCSAGTNVYSPFSESTLNGLEFKIIPADVIAFEIGLLHLALDTASHELVTCPPENIFLANVKSYINDMLQNKVIDTKVHVVMHSTKVLFVYDELSGNHCLHMCDDHHPVAILRKQKLPVTTCQLTPDLCNLNDSIPRTELGTDDTEMYSMGEESEACKQFLENKLIEEGATLQSSKRAISITLSQSLDAQTDVQVNSDDALFAASSALLSTQLSSSVDRKATEEDSLKFNKIQEKLTAAGSTTNKHLLNYVAPLMKKNLKQNCALLSVANKIILLPFSNIHNKTTILQEVTSQLQKKVSISLLCAKLEPPILFDQLSVNLVSVFAHVGQRPSCCQEILAFWGNKGNIISHLETYEMMCLSAATENSKLSVLGQIVVLADEYGILKFTVAINGTAYYAKFQIKALEVLDSLGYKTLYCTGYSVRACLFSCCYAVVEQDPSKHQISECGFTATHVLSGSVENILRNVAQNASNSKNWSLQLEYLVSLSSSQSLQTVEDWNKAYCAASSEDDIQPNFAKCIENLLRIGRQPQTFKSPNEGTSLKLADGVQVSCSQPNRSLDLKKSTKTTLSSYYKGMTLPTDTVISPANTKSTAPPSMGITLSPSTETTSSLCRQLEAIHLPTEEITLPPGIELSLCMEFISAPATKSFSSPETEIKSLHAEMTPSPGTEMTPSPGTEMISSPGTEMISSPGTETISSPGIEMISSRGMETTTSLNGEITMTLNNEKAASLNIGRTMSFNAETTASPIMEMTMSGNILPLMDITPTVDMERTSSIASPVYSEDTKLASCQQSKGNSLLEEFPCHVVALKPNYAILCNNDKYILLPLSNIFETCFLNSLPSIQATEQLMKNDIHVVCLQTKENIKIAKLSVNYFALFAYMADAPQILPDLVAHWKSFEALSKKNIAEILSVSRNSTASRQCQNVHGMIIAAANETALLKFQDGVSGQHQFAKVHLGSILFLPSTKPHLTIPNVNLSLFVGNQCVASVVYKNQFIFPCYQAIKAVVGNTNEVHNYMATDIYSENYTVNFRDPLKPQTTLNNAAGPVHHIDGLHTKKQKIAVKAKQEGQSAQSSKKIQTIQFDSVKGIMVEQSSTLTGIQATVGPSQIHKSTCWPPTTPSIGLIQAVVEPSQISKTAISVAAARCTSITQTKVAPSQVNIESLASAIAPSAELPAPTAKGTKSCQVAKVIGDSIMSSIKGVTSKKLQIPPVTNNILNKVHHYCAAVKHCSDDYAILYASNHYIFLPYNKLYSNSNMVPREILLSSEHSPSVLCVSIKFQFCVHDSFVDGFCFAAFFGKKPTGLETVKKVIEFSDPKILQQSIKDFISKYLPTGVGIVNSSVEDYLNTIQIETESYKTTSSSTVENLFSGNSSEDVAINNGIKTETLNQWENRPKHPSLQNYLTPTPNKVTSSGPNSVPTRSQSKYPNQHEVGKTQALGLKIEVKKSDKLVATKKINHSSPSIASKIGIKNVKKNQVSTSKKSTFTTSKLAHRTDHANLESKQTVTLKSVNNGSLKSSGKTIGANSSSDLPSISSVSAQITSAEYVLPLHTHVSPVHTQISSLLQGKICDTFPDLGELETADGKKLIFQPKQCFLFGISLQGLELWHILVKELGVEYEVNNDAGTLSIRAVYVGGWSAGQLSNREIKRNIIDWCLDNQVSEDARNSLVDRVAGSSIRRDIVPQIADDDDREVIIIGSDDSNEFDVELD